MDEKKKEIEETFRLSNSPDELFDAFQYALKIELKDIESYKILLANPYLSADEIKMFTEKLCSVVPDNAYGLFMWSGRILEHNTEENDKPGDALAYYKRAADENPLEFLPLLRILSLYNFEFPMNVNDSILQFVEDRVSMAARKEKIYYSLADIYKRKGELNKAARYLALAEKDQERHG